MFLSLIGLFFGVILWPIKQLLIESVTEGIFEYLICGNI